MNFRFSCLALHGVVAFIGASITYWKAFWAYIETPAFEPFLLAWVRGAIGDWGLAVYSLSHKHDS